MTAIDARTFTKRVPTRLFVCDDDDDGRVVIGGVVAVGEVIDKPYNF